MTAGTGPQPQNSYDANNRISASVYTYDAAGNVINDGIHSYTYDAENRIVKVDAGATALYGYDAEGRRVSKSVVTSGTQLEYLFDLAGRPVTEIQAGTSTTNRSEVYAGGRHLVAQNVTLGSSYFIHTDWLGTERARTDLSGNVVESCTSLAYGDSLTCTGTDVSPLHFTGKMRDTETGLDEFPARYYSSGLGRWYSPDWASAQIPIPYADMGKPQTLNLYDYVGSDPTNHADADGHVTTPGQGAGTACQGSQECADNKKGQTGDQKPGPAQNTEHEGAEITYFSDTRVTVSADTTTTTTNSDGSSTQTTVITNANFSREQGHEGEFIGATQEARTTTYSAPGTPLKDPVTTTTGPQAVKYGQAVREIGANGMALGSGAATPGWITHFGRSTAQDARQHPGKYVAAGLGVASGGSSLAGAALPAAILRVGAGAAALWEAVTHWH